ncbi:MAG: TonB-dependent receptor [Bacteroidales bacterium]|nr:TonB-dependent receptor [Bacteroidales bacterium]
MKQNKYFWILLFAGILFLTNIDLFSQKNDTLITVPVVDIISKKPLKERIVQRIKIDTTLIQNNLNNSLSELLSNHTTLFIKTYGQGSLATASFRGTGASHTSVEWNGININNPMLGQVDFSQLPIIFIDQVEILPGSSSLQNNSGALGGTINISSLPKFDKKLYGMAGFSYGSFNTKQSFAQIGGGNSKWQNRLRFFHETSENNFEYYNNANGLWNYEKQKNASYEKKGVLAETHYQASNNLFSASFWFHESNRNLPPIISFQGMERIEDQKDKDIRASLKWTSFFKNGNSDLNAGLSFGNLNYYLAHQTQFGLYENHRSSSESQSYFLKYKLEFNLRKNLFLRWNSNFDHAKAHYIDHRQNKSFSPKRNTLGSSLALFYTFRESTSFYVLARKEITDNELTPFMPAIGMEINNLFLKRFSFKTNFSSNYHQASLNDMYWEPGGNPDLKPEKAISADAELSYSNRQNSLLFYHISSTFYASLVDDWIVWQPSEFRYWTAQNIQEVFARGIETKAEIKTNFKNFNVLFFANYSFTKTENIETDIQNAKSLGNQLIYIPQNKSNVFVNFVYSGYQLNYTYNFIGKRFTSGNESDERHFLPWYNLHNIGFSKKWIFKHWSPDIELKINNLLNTDYQAILWRAMPKRNYSLTFKINF